MPGDNTEKFATYYRHGDSGLDYAVNRYYNPVSGRFTTADPYKASAGVEDPGSWNRFAYVGGDPVSFYDPSGRISQSPDAPGCGPEWESDASLSGPCEGPGVVLISDGPGGGVSWEEILGPDADEVFYANSLVSKAEVRRRRLIRIGEIIAAYEVIRRLRSNVPDFLWPAYLKFAGACYTQGGGAGAVSLTLRVTYRVLDQFGERMYGSTLEGFTISESSPYQAGRNGDLNRQAASWRRYDGTIRGNGEFDDYLSAGGLLPTQGFGTALQTFTVTGGLPVLQPLPVIGLPGPSGATGISGILTNTYSQSGITLNGAGPGFALCK